MDFMKLKRKKTVFDNFDNLSNASCHLFKEKIFEKTVENAIRLHVTCLRYLNLQKMKNNRISRVQKRRKKINGRFFLSVYLCKQNSSMNHTDKQLQCLIAIISR